MSAFYPLSISHLIIFNGIWEILERVILGPVPQGLARVCVVQRRQSTTAVINQVVLYILPL